jgi:RNA polymerase sigma-70 factor (ECF subfamily)
LWARRTLERNVELRDRFESLYLLHAGEVRRFVMRRGGEAGADDVVAEVFLSAWRRLDEVPSRPLPWLLGIARGVLANRRRADERHAALIARLASQTRTAARDDVETSTVLVEALGSLSPSDQELLLLVAWERLSTSELAEALSHPPGLFAHTPHTARKDTGAPTVGAGRWPTPVAAPMPYLRSGQG